MFAFGLAGCGASSFNSFVDYFRMPLGRDNFLCNKNLIADGAVFTLSLAGCGAGWLDCRVDDLGMSLRGYFLHAGESLAADRALCAGCMTSLGAGCGLLGNFNGSMTGSIDCFGFGFVANRAGVGLDAGILTGRRGRDLALIPTVALGGNLFLCNKNLVADGAMFAFGLAGCGASSFNSFVDHLGMTRSGDFLNSGNRCAADRALGAGCVSVLSAGCGLFSNINGSMTGSRNNLTVADLLIAVRAVGIAGVAWLGAGCFLGITKFCVLMCARRAAPYAFDIVDNIASLGSLRLGVRAVGVVQLGGGDGDGHRIIPVRIILIGRGFFARCALLNIFAGAFAGADIRAALGGVDGANSRYAAVHIHLRINQVVIGAVVCLTRRIGHGLKLAGAPDKVVGVPLIAVIEIDILPVCNCQTSALGNIDLNARQQSGILIDGHISGLDIDGDVIGDGQHIACRVDIHARKR